MAFRPSLLTLLAAVFLCLGVCAARSVPMRRDLRPAVSLPSFDHILDTVEIWKRRVHDSSADSSSSSSSSSDSDSDSTSTSTTSSTTTANNNDGDDDDNTSSTTSTTNRCLKDKNVTRVIQNDDGYGHYYSSGIGSENSTAGGTTPDGSGTAPRFDNSTGAFVTLADDDAANDVSIDNQHYLSYLGGAAIPFKSGDDSPNGLSPKKFDNLVFATVDEDSVKDGSCAVPNTSYAYEYRSKYSLSSGSVPVYCVCDPYGLCGCDDHHGNSSFVDAMLAYVGLDGEAKNISKACTVLLDGATTILVDGGLSNGSTKADPDADAVFAREPRTKGGRCPGSGGNGTGAATALSVNSWLAGMVLLGMASIVVS
ncbi:uncharacterized protein BDV17DRAFT_107682 [Aspergillus undulatus]|uniref:uncharacterized protein n=1 Tax=Aspergillus undulatus TaxID=1810928 RepID=UPI003CCCFD5E